MREEKQRRKQEKQEKYITIKKQARKKTKEKHKIKEE